MCRFVPEMDSGGDSCRKQIEQEKMNDGGKQSGNSTGQMEDGDSGGSLDQQEGEYSDSSSDQNGNGDSDGSTDQQEGGQSDGSVDQNGDGAYDDFSGQQEGGQSSESSDQDPDRQTSDGAQSDDGQADEDSENVEDDDEWADGDDEWTDAWTGADDDMEDIEWADDKEKISEAEVSSADRAEPYAGETVYTAKTVTSGRTSNSYAKLDQNYKTGAGVGNDIFLLLAVICGIAAIGLAAAKSMCKN